jgi:hypothetical protein
MPTRSPLEAPRPGLHLLQGAGRRAHSFLRAALILGWIPTRGAESPSKGLRVVFEGSSIGPWERTAARTYGVRVPRRCVAASVAARFL